MPCTTRAAINANAFGANAQASDAAVKTANPIMKIFLAPKRSPNAPAVKINAAKAMV